MVDWVGEKTHEKTISDKYLFRTVFSSLSHDRQMKCYDEKKMNRADENEI